MIKITSFYPFSGWLKVTQEFYEDKFIVKTKSPTTEQTVEYSYNQVAEISSSFNSSSSMMNFSSGLIILLGFALTIFYNLVCNNIIAIRIIQVLYIFGYLVFFTGLVKRWYILFFDANGNHLSTIKQTRRNTEAIAAVQEMIARKTEGFRQTTAAIPFPTIRENYEHTYVDVEYQKRTTDRFYENEIIGFEKGWFTERVYNVKYSVLNGNVLRGRAGIKAWGAVFSLSIMALSTLIGIHRGFSLLTGKFLLYALITCAIMLVISLLLLLIKQDIVGLYDKNGRIAYWAYVNKKGKEKFEKIIEFVQSRIPAENKEAFPKETQ